MLKFVILSSNKKNIRGYELIVDKLLINEKIQYKCYKFNDNDKEFKNFIKQKHDENIYIIEQDNKIDSLEIIQNIRNNHNDLTSFIIIIDFKNTDKSNYIEENYCINTKILYNEEKLSKIIRQIIKYYDNNTNKLTINYSGYINNVSFSNILYIEKETDSKLCKIVCLDGTYHINKSLKKIKELLNDEFIQTHQSAIVNIKNISKIDFTNKIIKFINNKEINLFARSYNKILKDKITEQGQKVTE